MADTTALAVDSKRRKDAGRDAHDAPEYHAHSSATLVIMTDMNPATAEEAKATLADAVGLWRLTPGVHIAGVIDAATACLVAGIDSPSLRELAGASPRESQFVLEPLVLDTLDELAMAEVLDADIQAAALRAMLRRLDEGGLAPRKLASWAHRNIGHDGGPECQPFVELDDMYDEAEYMGYDERVLDEWMREEAAAFLSGRPTPGRSLDWRTGPPSTSKKSLLDRLRSRVRRPK